MDPVAKLSPSTVAPVSKPTRRRTNRPVGRPPQHGVSAANRVLKTLPLSLVDRRSAAGVYLRKVERDLTSQLGDPSPA